MQRFVYSLAVAALVTFTARAAEKFPLLKIGSETYTNVVVTSVTATDVFFSHSRGMGNAKLKNLEPELQKRFKFNPAKAQEVEKKQSEANYAFRQDLGRKSASVSRSASARETGGTDGEIAVREIHALQFRGRTAPRFVAEKWLTPVPNTAGKCVLIHFWATWCGPCRASIPELNKLHARFSDKLVIIGLSDESEAEVRALKSPKIDYHVAIDTSATMKTAVGVQGIPHALLLDPNGVVRFEGHPGYLNERNVAALLAKYSP